MSDFLNRKPQPRRSSENRVDFPKNAKDSDGWSHIVRFLRLDAESHITYKYCRHVFKTMPGMGVREDHDGNQYERKDFSMAYCLGSPSNPFSQGDVEMNEEGVAECMSIVMPNGVPLHELMSERGDRNSLQLRERCLVWSWSNNHLAIIDRPPGFFDTLREWAVSFGSDPFLYTTKDPARMGYDVVIQTKPKGGSFYDYAFSAPPPSDKRNIQDVRALITQQMDSVMKDFNVVQSKESIMQSLGISGVGASASASGSAAKSAGDGGFGDGSAPGKVADLREGGDGLDNMEDSDL